MYVVNHSLVSATPQCLNVGVEVDLFIFVSFPDYVRKT